jgi:arginine decarboxylase-like protein
MMEDSFHNSFLEDNDILEGLNNVTVNAGEYTILQRDKEVEKTLTVLEYLKIELAKILPQIEEAAKTANIKYKQNENKLTKVKKKLINIINEAKEGIVK